MYFVDKFPVLWLLIDGCQQPPAVYFSLFIEPGVHGVSLECVPFIREAEVGAISGTTLKFNYCWLYLEHVYNKWVE